MRERLVALLLLAGCGMPLLQAPPPPPPGHTALIPPPDSATEIMALAMHRTGCLGSCPDYYYSFARQGQAIREGLGFVPFARCAVGTLPPGAFDDLARRLFDSGFFGRDSTLGPLIFDVPYLAVIARLRDGRGHAVHGAMVPRELSPISIAIDSIGALVHWEEVPAVRLGGRSPECPWSAGDATSG